MCAGADISSRDASLFHNWRTRMATATASKSAALAAARKRWGTREQIWIRESKFRSSPEERATNSAKRTQLNARLREIEEALKGPDVVVPLVKAARFVVDVEGQEPSMSQLRTAVEAAERVESLKAERIEVRADRDRISIDHYKWSVCRTIAHGLAYSSIMHADTLAELIEKISAKPDED